MELPMPAQTPFVGTNFEKGLGDGVAAAQPFVQQSQQLKQMGEQEETKQKALAYQNLLRSGSDGMTQYASEIAKEYPDLGNQLTKEASQYANFFSDPALTGDKAEEYAHHFYESANNRVKAIKDAKAVKPPEVKPWAPTTAQEAEDWYRTKKEIDADNRPPPKTGPGSSVEAAKKMKALKEIPSLWSQIEEMQRTGGTVPLIPGKAEPDVRAFTEGQSKQWRAKWDDLRKQLNAKEATAGLESSIDIMGPGLDNSQSYKLYKSLRTKGGQGGMPAPAATAATPAPAKSQNSSDAALAWLKSPKSKSSPYRAGILQELKKSGVDINGL